MKAKAEKPEWDFSPRANSRRLALGGVILLVFGFAYAAALVAGVLLLIASAFLRSMRESPPEDATPKSDSVEDG